MRRTLVSLLSVVLVTAVLSACARAQAPPSPSASRVSSPAAVNGFYVGSGNGGNMNAMSNYMQTKVQWAADYAGWDGPTPWGIGQWENVNQPHVLWSMWFLPEIVADKAADPVGWLNEVKTDMNLAASGAYDQHWIDMGRRMASTSRQGKDALRIGWELGGDWYPWGSRVFAGAGALQKQAWQHYATAIRTSGWQVKTVWDSDDTTALPDPSLIDVVTAGGYDAPADGWAGCGVGGHNPDGTWLHPAEVFACHEQGMGPRLAAAAALAQSIGKPMGIPEWGLSNGNDDTYFVQAIHDFVVTHNVMFSIYFSNDNSSTWGEMHNLSHFPNGEPLFHKLFSET